MNYKTYKLSKARDIKCESDLCEIWAYNAVTTYIPYSSVCTEEWRGIKSLDELANALAKQEDIMHSEFIIGEQKIVCGLQYSPLSNDELAELCTKIYKITQKETR